MVKTCKENLKTTIFITIIACLVSSAVSVDQLRFAKVDHNTPKISLEAFLETTKKLEHDSILKKLAETGVQSSKVSQTNTPNINPDSKPRKHLKMPSRLERYVKELTGSSDISQLKPNQHVSHLLKVDDKGRVQGTMTNLDIKKTFGVDQNTQSLRNHKKVTQKAKKMLKSAHIKKAKNLNQEAGRAMGPNLKQRRMTILATLRAQKSGISQDQKTISTLDLIRLRQEQQGANSIWNRAGTGIIGAGLAQTSIHFGAEVRYTPRHHKKKKKPHPKKVEKVQHSLFHEAAKEKKKEESERKNLKKMNKMSLFTKAEKIKKKVEKKNLKKMKAQRKRLRGKTRFFPKHQFGFDDIEMGNMPIKPSKSKRPAATKKASPPQLHPVPENKKKHTQAKASSHEMNKAIKHRHHQKKGSSGFDELLDIDDMEIKDTLIGELVNDAKQAIKKDINDEDLEGFDVPDIKIKPTEPHHHNLESLDDIDKMLKEANMHFGKDGGLHHIKHKHSHLRKKHQRTHKKIHHKHHKSVGLFKRSAPHYKYHLKRTITHHHHFKVIHHRGKGHQSGNHRGFRIHVPKKVMKKVKKEAGRLAKKIAKQVIAKRLKNDAKKSDTKQAKEIKSLKKYKKGIKAALNKKIKKKIVRQLIHKLVKLKKSEEKKKAQSIKTIKQKKISQDSRKKSVNVSENKHKKKTAALSKKASHPAKKEKKKTKSHQPSSKLLYMKNLKQMVKRNRSGKKTTKKIEKSSKISGKTAVKVKSVKKEEKKPSPQKKKLDVNKAAKNAPKTEAKKTSTSANDKSSKSHPKTKTPQKKMKRLKKKVRKTKKERQTAKSAKTISKPKEDSKASSKKLESIEKVPTKKSKSQRKTGKSTQKPQPKDIKIKESPQKKKYKAKKVKSLKKLVHHPKAKAPQKKKTKHTVKKFKVAKKLSKNANKRTKSLRTRSKMIKKQLAHLVKKIKKSAKRMKSHKLKKRALKILSRAEKKLKNHPNDKASKRMLKKMVTRYKHLKIKDLARSKTKVASKIKKESHILKKSKNQLKRTLKRIKKLNKREDTDLAVSFDHIEKKLNKLAKKKNKLKHRIQKSKIRTQQLKKIKHKLNKKILRFKRLKIRPLNKFIQRRSKSVKPHLPTKNKAHPKVGKKNKIIVEKKKKSVDLTRKGKKMREHNGKKMSTRSVQKKVQATAVKVNQKKLLKTPQGEKKENKISKKQENQKIKKEIKEGTKIKIIREIIKKKNIKNKLPIFKSKLNLVPHNMKRSDGKKIVNVLNEVKNKIQAEKNEIKSEDSKLKDTTQRLKRISRSDLKEAKNVKKSIGVIKDVIKEEVNKAKEVLLRAKNKAKKDQQSHRKMSKDVKKGLIKVAKAADSIRALKGKEAQEHLKRIKEKRNELKVLEVTRKQLKKKMRKLVHHVRLINRVVKEAKLSNTMIKDPKSKKKAQEILRNILKKRSEIQKILQQTSRKMVGIAKKLKREEIKIISPKRARKPLLRRPIQRPKITKRRLPPLQKRPLTGMRKIIFSKPKLSPKKMKRLVKTVSSMEKKAYWIKKEIARENKKIETDLNSHKKTSKDSNKLGERGIKRINNLEKLYQKRRNLKKNISKALKKLKKSGASMKITHKKNGKQNIEITYKRDSKYSANLKKRLQKMDPRVLEALNKLEMAHLLKHKIYKLARHVNLQARYLRMTGHHESLLLRSLSHYRRQIKREWKKRESIRKTRQSNQKIEDMLFQELHHNRKMNKKREAALTLVEKKMNHVVHLLAKEE